MNNPIQNMADNVYYPITSVVWDSVWNAVTIHVWNGTKASIRHPIFSAVGYEVKLSTRVVLENSTARGDYE